MDVEDTMAQRPVGVSSRLRYAPGPRSGWESPDGPLVDLPVILDYVGVRPDGSESFRIEATVGLVNGVPELVQMRAESTEGLDLIVMQRDFRWASPLEAVTRLVPAMIERGEDPFTVDFPLEGYPEVTRGADVVRRQLTDEFLEDVARDYLSLGRGYARRLAARYSVSERTVVSWVERGRARGILTSVPRGVYGGQLVPQDQRPQQVR